jgi:hypothetical protein
VLGLLVGLMYGFVSHSEGVNQQPIERIGQVKAKRWKMMFSMPPSRNHAFISMRCSATLVHKTLPDVAIYKFKIE